VSMKKYLLYFISILLIFSAFPVMAQKVTVRLKRSEESSLSFWRINDINGTEVISANGHQNEDSVIFSLEADKQYSLWIIVPETEIPFTSEYILGINGENILRIKDQLSSGEHEYKFFTGTRQPASKIIGGTTADITEFPWMVLYRSQNYGCGGTIIAPGWILTAAHCTEDSNNNPISFSEMSVIAGSTTPFNNNSGSTYSVSYVIRHEGYNPSTKENDIALLKLNTDIAGAKPIKLISSYDVSDGSIAPGVMAWVTGWGVTNSSSQVMSATLQKVQLPIVSNAQAGVVWNFIPVTDLMAGYLKGTKDACSGDSGGPLIVPVTGEYKIAGIVSWGNKTCNTYGGYTNVSRFLDWISEATGIIDYRPAVPGGSNVICNLSDTTSYNLDPGQGEQGYEWKLYPENTGTISSISSNAEVTWNNLYTGQANVMVRTTLNHQLSDWSKLKVMVAPRREILHNSNDTSICQNLPVKLKVDAEGYNLSYKWYKNSSAIPAGILNTLSFQSLNSSNSGIYKCEVSNACGSSYTNDIRLTVVPLTSITGLSQDLEIAAGSNAILNVAAEGNDLSFHWQKDGKLVDEVDDPNLPLYDVNAKDLGIYQVTVKGTCGNVVSDSIYVFVRNADAIGKSNIFVWPTLTTEELNVAINDDNSYTILMYDLKGSLIKELRNCRYQTTLNVGGLPRGTYVLNVFNSTTKKSIKIIKI
jgi:hypothetical protein